MYVVIAKKVLVGMGRGFQSVLNNHVVVTAPDEASLEKTINDLTNEQRGERHEIVQVLWKG